MNQVPSPCIAVCRLDENGICIGCKRTRSEIAIWSYLFEEEKQEIVDRINNESSDT